MNYLRIFIMAGIFASISPGIAAADPVDAWLGFTVNGTFGQHVEPGVALNVPLLPLPVVDARVRVRDVELRAEALPPIGPIAWNNSNVNIHTTRLGYASAVLYYHLRGGFSAGAGGTVITQYSTFEPAPYGEPLTQSGRVAGLRWAAMEQIPIARDTTVTATFADSPVMHAAVTSTFAPHTFPTMSNGETAALVDASVSAERQFGGTALEAGVRYLNYSARFDNGTLADRNRFLMPFAGIHWRLR